jgi:hypothetical protein
LATRKKNNGVQVFYCIKTHQAIHSKGEKDKGMKRGEERRRGVHEEVLLKS